MASDLSRIMGRPVTRDAIIVWNGEAAITVTPEEFPKMREIIEREGEQNFDDDDNGSFGVQIAWLRSGEDSGLLEFTPDEFEDWLAEQRTD